MYNDENIELLYDIRSLLSDIKENLQNMIIQQYLTNIMLENINSKPKYKNVTYISYLPNMFLKEYMGKSVIVFGVKKNKLIEALNMYAENIGVKVQLCDKINSAGDLAAILTSCKENDVLMIDLSCMVVSKELVDVLKNAYSDDKMICPIGKGADIREVQIDLPQLRYVFYSNNELLVPKLLKEDVELCIYKREN